MKKDLELHKKQELRDVAREKRYVCSTINVSTEIYMIKGYFRAYIYVISSILESPLGRKDHNENCLCFTARIVILLKMKSSPLNQVLGHQQAFNWLDLVNHLYDYISQIRVDEGGSHNLSQLQ